LPAGLTIHEATEGVYTINLWCNCWCLARRAKFTEALQLTANIWERIVDSDLITIILLLIIVLCALLMPPGPGTPLRAPAR